MNRFFLFLSLFFVLLAPLAMAQPICPLDGKPIKPQGVKSLQSFKHIAILDQGRVKPLETYAQNLLLQFSGQRTVGRKPAIRWLADFLFAPETSKSDQIFLINNPEILNALGVNPEAKRRYSFEQLEAGYPKLAELAQASRQMEKKNRSLVEEEIIRVEENLRLYSELSHVFMFALPHSDFALDNPQALQKFGLPENAGALSFIDIALRAEMMKSSLDVLSTKSQSQWSESEKQIVRVLTNLYHWSLYYRELPFTIIPSFKPADEKWLSPWDALNNDFQSNMARQELLALRTMVVTYWNGQQIEFDLAVKSLNDSIPKRAAPKIKRSITQIPLELLYNHLNPLLWAKILYGVAFILILAALNNFSSNLYRPAWLLASGGFFLNTLALIMRIIILARPPVSNLYETFVFVAFMSALVGILIERVNKKGLGLVIASICGFVFLLISTKFAAEGDTLKMLVAVLDSNFWLSTHVLSITTGYAGTCVAGVIGHIYIIHVLAGTDKKSLESIYKILVGTLGFGLTVTFLGTNLGGIWADQSWGRFWGWDPKENGALLIILWTALIFHAKIARMIGPLGVAAGSILGIIVVMWAWFGVNLLGVGLHSYGFTSGVAVGLGIYVFLQIIFLIFAVPRAKKQLKS